MAKPIIQQRRVDICCRITVNQRRFPVDAAPGELLEVFAETAHPDCIFWRIPGTAGWTLAAGDDTDDVEEILKIFTRSNGRRLLSRHEAEKLLSTEADIRRLISGMIENPVPPTSELLQALQKCSAIYADFNGSNQSELADKYGLFTREVYQIIKFVSRQASWVLDAPPSN